MSDSTANIFSDSARPGSAGLRQRIAQAFADVLEQSSATQIANRLGHAVSTIGRREANIGSWPADEFLTLALDDTALATAIRQYLTGDMQPEGHGLMLHTDLVVEVLNSAKVTGKVAEALADGRVSVAEARAVLQAIQDRRKHEDAVLVPDLNAAIRNIA